MKQHSRSGQGHGQRRFIGRLSLLGVLAPIICLTPALASGATVTLPAGEMRSVELGKEASIETWLERNDVEPLEHIPLPTGGVIVRFAMEEGVWRARSGALCTDEGVVSCGTDFCQTYFVPQATEQPATGTAQAEMPQQNESDAEARLELRLFESADVGEPSGIDAQVITEDGAAVAGARVLLVPRAPAVESLFDTAPESPVDADAVAGERSCSRTSGLAGSAGAAGGSGAASPARPAGSLLMALSSNTGAFAFPQAGAPGVDRGCWEMITAAACQVRVRPLCDLLPEREPRRLLVLAPLSKKGVDAGLMGRLGSLPGLRVLDSTVLASIERAIVRLQIEDETLDPASALANLQEQEGVEAAQPEYRHRTAAQFNDPYAWMNYGARLTGADKLLSATTGAGVRIAVIDSGVDSSHPELAARVAERLDVTGYGESADRHGTAIAGLIAAEANNEVGAFGMAPGASLIAIKACEPETRGGVAARCWSSTIARALDAALQREAALINMSLAGPEDPLIARLIDAALARSRLVIAAAGNGGPDAKPSFPASHPGVLAVTAIGPRARLYSQATRGAFIDIAGPGVEVPVPVPGSTYPGQLSGTSMATAHVTGVAALLLSGAPQTGAAELRAALESSAVPAGAAGEQQSMGRGRVDACAAARALGEQIAACAATPAGDEP